MDKPHGFVEWCAVEGDVRAHVLEDVGQQSPGWVVVYGQFGMDTLPEAIIAASRKGAALDRSGSTLMSSGSASCACSTIQWPGSGMLVCPSAASTSCMVMRICGMLGRCSPVWVRSRPPARREPMSSSPEMNCDDDDESMATCCRVAGMCSGGVMVNGNRPRSPRR